MQQGSRRGNDIPRLCALCGALSTTTAQQDCGHWACEACCYAVTDLETKTVRCLCDDCGEDGPVAWSS
jgi:hypothetical protein